MGILETVGDTYVGKMDVKLHSGSHITMYNFHDRSTCNKKKM